MAKRLIIDVDTGVDDAQAIMLALSSKNVEIVAITCVQGNVDVDNVCQNTLRVLTICERLDIPVFKGCAKPLTGCGPDATYFHGKDGMGDVENPVPVDIGLVKTEHAVLALIRLVNKYPGEITLVALAPLTNIAMAVRLDPYFGSKLKEVVMMGGNIQGKGNTTPAAEFNFAADPEAAYVTLNELRCPIINVSWETCLSGGMSLEWYNKWRSVDTVKGRFNKAISQHTSAYYMKHLKIYRSCDLITMATVVKDDIVTEIVETYATVELAGTLTKGQMVVDWRGVLGKPNNIKIVKAVDYEKAKELFYDMV